MKKAQSLLLNLGYDRTKTELYPFVSWEDKEPTLIQDILDRYEVIENEKIFIKITL